MTFTSLLGFQNDSSAWIRALALLPQIYQAQLEPDAHLWNAIIGDVSASGHWRLSFWDLAIHRGVDGSQIESPRSSRERVSLKKWSDDMMEDSFRFTGWWFQIFFIFTPTWGNDPI